MKRPSFQFYPADWRNNAKLRRCSEGARGSWMDILCILHDSDEYGVVRWPLEDLARAAGIPLKFAKELVAKEVLKGGDKGCAGYTHTPIHARKAGEPVVLLAPTTSPCWYSSRFLVDEWRRSVKGASTRFESSEETPNPSPSHGKVKGRVNGNDTPSQTPSARQGDGSTSTSTPTVNNTDPNGSVVGAAAPPDCPHLEIIKLYNETLPELQQVIPERWGGTRAKHLQARWRESTKHQSLKFWQAFFAELRNHPFYLGENDRGWKADLAWLIERGNFDKMLERFVSARNAA